MSERVRTCWIVSGGNLSKGSSSFKNKSMGFACVEMDECVRLEEDDCESLHSSKAFVMSSLAGSISLFLRLMEARAIRQNNDDSSY